MITIDDPETERLARDLAARSGESVEAVVRAALKDRADATPAPSAAQAEAPPEVQSRRRAALLAFREEIAKLPVLDPRSPDEILGYDENGLPT